ncbi:unnamed protein product [Phaedon cochleariae]|uniref:Nbr1 FW domain-containing protein n=1 Tax=Phaedon cochleariae TaxID=80249 RepID=A0A9N9SH19_PHACE|nr:unnamed protein product [Phaedon cochleariae]
MSSKKKDLEIIYNLQWKSKPANGGDKANIIGMYDIPATTLNWEIFKSYLLKNSGTVGVDVKVSYITDSNREFPIESQTDFQIALYAFRRKARMGDIVNLKLERISEQPLYKNIRHSNDVETQFSNEATPLVSKCCSSASPPEWFTAYMAQFKKNWTEEITATMSCIVSNIKPHTISQPTCYHMRKSKPESSKRIRKLPLLTGESSHETKDIIKTLKIEGKLERKLEKLEHKTKKIRDKKMALFAKSSDSEAGHSSGRGHGRTRKHPLPQRDGEEKEEEMTRKHLLPQRDGGEEEITRKHLLPQREREEKEEEIIRKHLLPQRDGGEEEDEIAQMGASPVNTQEIVPHMLGGEVYLHQWEVINTGKLPWTKQTALLFTWGSKALKPLDTIVPVPHLKPGDIGKLSVRLQVPNYPGQYECYWHFHHKERRFGHWLGCQIIVDEFNLKGNKSVLETSYQSRQPKPVKPSVAGDFYRIDGDSMVKQYSNVWQGAAPSDGRCTLNLDLPLKAEEAANINDEESDSAKQDHEQLVRRISVGIEDIKLQDPTDTNDSDSDNQSIVSLTESNSSKGYSQGYVVVPLPECFKIDNMLPIEKTDEGMSSDSVKTVVPPVIEVEPIATTKVPAVTATASADKSEAVDEQGDCFDRNNNSEDVDQNSAGSVQKADDACSTSSRKSDIVMVTMPEGAEKDSEEYAYVIVDGQRVPIPKKIIKSEYLQTIVRSPESTPDNISRFSSANSSVEILNKEELPDQTQKEVPATIDTALAADPKPQEPIETAENPDCSGELLSHCSAAGSCFSDANGARLFVFPQDCPGYEVVYPADELARTAEGCEYTWAKSETHYAYPNPDDPSAPAHPLQDPLVPTPIANTASLAGESNPSAAALPTPDGQTATPPNPHWRTADPQPLNLSTGVPVCRQATAQEAARGAHVDREIPEGPFTATSTPQSHGESPIRDFLAAERARKPAPKATSSEALFQGASTVFNTARSVINRMVPQELPFLPANDVPQQPGKWVNGHWVSTNPETPREANLQALAEMGFWNRDLNATLLARYEDDLSRVVAELVQ